MSETTDERLRDDLVSAVQGAKLRGVSPTLVSLEVMKLSLAVYCDSEPLENLPSREEWILLCGMTYDKFRLGVRL